MTHPTAAAIVISELMREVEQLQADKRRLDWLENNDYPCFERWSIGWGLGTHEHATLRAAIDAEMENFNA